MAPDFGMMDEFEQARELCQRLEVGLPQEIWLGESHWVYVQLTVSEARILAAKLEGKEP